MAQARNLIRERLRFRMDAIAGLLDGPRAREAFLLRSSLDPPWSLRIQDEAPLTVLSMVRGEAWAIHDGGDPVPLRTGDVAVFRGPDPYTVADDPETAPLIASTPARTARPARAPRSSLESFSLGVRTWGNAADGATIMLTGTYTLDGEVSGRLLRALPALLVLRAGEWDCPVVPLLADEIVKDEPGQEAVLDRLLDLLLIAVLRAWFARPARLAGVVPRHGDPVVGHALRLLHHNPAHPWTVAELAHETGASRAALARRFNDLVGEPPMASSRAGGSPWPDLLLEPGATVGSVAERVGYGSPFALDGLQARARDQPAGAPGGGWGYASSQRFPVTQG